MEATIRDIQERDLETVPLGVYRLPNRDVRSVYDLRTGERVTGPVELLARVIGKIPTCDWANLDHITVRGNGDFIVRQWSLER